MDIHIKSLTEAGLIKISLPSSHASKSKIRLYRFSDQTPEGMAKIQTIFELEMKGRIYKGFVSAMFQEISNRPYLFKEGSHFKLISREDTLSVGYSRAGYIHYKSGEYHKALPWYERDLKFALEFKHKLGEGRAYCNLGNAYDSLGDARKAINFHKKHLKSTLELEDKSGEGIAYGNLGNACSSLGETRKAIDFHEKRLKIVLELQDEEGEGASYCSLGNAYGSLGEIRKAIDFHDKHLKITLKLQNKGGEGRAYGHLGNAYRSLGEIHQAINFHEKALKIALELQDKVREGRAYVNLGNAYDSLREHSRAIDFYNKSLKSALELQDKNWEGVTYGNLGNAHDSLGETRKAIAFHKKALKIALELQDRGGEKRAYCNLGNAYYFLGEIRKAIDFYNKSLKIALELQDKSLEGVTYGNLGSAYNSLEKCSQAEKYFRQSIEIFASLQQDAKRAQWQISIFEELSKPYVGLEQLLFKIGDIRALEISDTRRARALSSLLFERLNLKENQDFHLNLLSVQDMQGLAEKLDTTFMIYSLNIVNNKVMSVHAWVVSCEQQPIQSFSLSIPEDAFSELDHIFKTFPYQMEKTRPVRGEKQPTQLFEERLSYWYDLLIAPLESYLPSPDSGKTLTLIPDGFLAHLPFGAFYNRKKDQYLIENYPISIAPSIQVLSLLDQLPKEPLNEALLMGNPKTPQEAYNNLKKSETEVRDIIARLMQNIDIKVLTQEEATVGNVFTHAPHARVIHIAGHGVANQKPLDDPYSVFEGLFRLAPDHKHLAGDLHAKDVHLLKLKADLVFMSACHLGRGNLKREGSIGPVWSFLGSGAKSTIASYWPLPEGDMTLKMVDTFYQHYLGVGTLKLNKAKALQKAVLMAMKTERNKPRQWGAFFLAGLMD
ncbi:MAG: CHAT domain-containing protein [Candidatus Rhabdochlamydia sp.]